MGSRDNPIFEQWREALKAADAADRANFAATMAFIDRQGPPPTQAQWDEASALRQRARVLLAELTRITAQSKGPGAW